MTTDEQLDRTIALIRDWWASAKDPKRPHTWPGHPHWFETAVREWREKARRWDRYVESKEQP